jgi:hypothetical protein
MGEIMVKIRRWLSWAFAGFLVFYGPIFIFNNFYKSDSPPTPEELEARGDWRTEQRAGMTAEDIERQRQNINAETTSPAFAAGSPLDRLQQPAGQAAATSQYPKDAYRSLEFHRRLQQPQHHRSSDKQFRLLPGGKKLQRR